jgi:hypothetical protein
MSSFDEQINGFVLKVETKSRAAFVGVTTEVQRSVVFGSELTSAPGQPVDTGNLRDSWIGEFLDAWTWRLTTNVLYALYVEENVRGVVFKNHGPHSVQLTILHFPRIVAAVAAREAA